MATARHRPWRRGWQRSRGNGAAAPRRSPARAIGRGRRRARGRSPARRPARRRRARADRRRVEADQPARRPVSAVGQPTETVDAVRWHRRGAGDAAAAAAIELTARRQAEAPAPRAPPLGGGVADRDHVADGGEAGDAPEGRRRPRVERDGLDRDRGAAITGACGPAAPWLGTALAAPRAAHRLMARLPARWVGSPGNSSSSTTVAASRLSPGASLLVKLAGSGQAAPPDGTTMPGCGAPVEGALALVVARAARRAGPGPPDGRRR